MSFFKDLKEDIQQSVNELTETFDEEPTGDVADVAVEDFAVDAPMPEDDGIEEPAMMFTKPAEELDISPMEFTSDTATADDAEKSLEDALAAAAAVTEPEPVIPEPEPVIPESIPEPEPVMSAIPEPVVPETPVMPVAEEAVPETVAFEEPEPEISAPAMEEMMTNTREDISMTSMSAESMEDLEMSTDEVTVITKGTTINGGIKSDTSLVVKGTIEGDVECAGKLTITGRVAGNTNASEIYVNTPRLEGDLNSKGIVKIDVGTVVIGGINSTSVVVAGAVKGNIEVTDKLILESSSQFIGNIKTIIIIYDSRYC